MYLTDSLRLPRFQSSRTLSLLSLFGGRQGAKWQHTCTERPVSGSRKLTYPAAAIPAPGRAAAGEMNRAPETRSRALFPGFSGYLSRRSRAFCLIQAYGQDRA